MVVYDEVPVTVALMYAVNEGCCTETPIPNDTVLVVVVIPVVILNPTGVSQDTGVVA